MMRSYLPLPVSSSTAVFICQNQEFGFKFRLDTMGKKRENSNFKFAVICFFT
jgi:hypothetical protein